MQLRVLYSFAARRRRFSKFGLSPLDALPVADLDLRLACESRRCSPVAASITECVRRLRRDRDGKISGFFKDTAAVTDLTLFADMGAYLKAVSKETDGKHNRSANKARRAGYFTRQIALSSYAQSHFDIKASKLTRSHGTVLEATNALSRPDGDSRLPPVAPSCRQHWRIDFGLFSKADERMWGFASLVRSGNVVQLDHMIAHADVLQVGGMKLLQFDMMEWLLNRTEPLLDGGVDYLLHGAIEDGGDGAADWRRYLHQRPHALRLSKPEEIRLPADFDPKGYLAANADVRSAKANPRQHFLRHGMVEGRRYKVDAPLAPQTALELERVLQTLQAVFVRFMLSAATVSAIFLHDALPLVG